MSSYRIAHFSVMVMRILLVTPSYFPIVGGSEVLTQVLSSKLNELGIHSDIMTFNMDEKWNPKWTGTSAKNGKSTVFKEPAVNLFPNLPNPLFNLLRMNVLPSLGYLKKLRGYDVIHFISEADLGFPLFSYSIKKPKLLQCVGIFRKGGIFKYYMNDRAFLGKTFTKIFPKLADLFIISSEEEQELLIEMGLQAEKVRILPIGVDTEIFSPDQTKKNDALILFVGRIDKAKGLHSLIEALKYLEVPVQLAIVGPKWDPDYSRRIEEMSRQINEKGFHKITFLGSMDQSSLVSWYQRASILVCPYVYETHSNVAREALSCGTPVLSTGSHLTENGSDGILLTSREPREMANSICTFLRDKQTRDKYGRQGRKMIEEYFSWKSVIKDLVEIYEGMLHR
jgi:glycosyltransferase involved in cell wall biosynthesis